MNKNIADSAKCPFYHHETAKTIVCEGADKKSDYTTVHFPKKEYATVKRHDHCNSTKGCQGCHIYEACYKAWEDSVKK